jgi:hypothetical protein
MKRAFIGPQAPKSSVPNIEQEVWQMKATTRIVLPHFANAGKPFALLFWSRDPDVSQHGTKDSVGEYVPGINGPSGKAATRNADTMLGDLLAALKQQGLDKNTDVFVTADHAFSPSVMKAKLALGKERPAGTGFPCLGPGQRAHPAQDQQHGAGADAQKPDVIVASNGGADLIYLPQNNKKLAGDIVKFLTTQDYVGAVFVTTSWARFPARFPMSDLNLVGSAKTPVPSIYVSFRSFARDVREQAANAAWESMIPAAPPARGSHGSLSRAETRNFMAAIGPELQIRLCRSCSRSPMPISRPTLAAYCRHQLTGQGQAQGTGDQRGIDGRERGDGTAQDHSIGPGGEWRAHYPELPAGRRAALFRCRGLCRKGDRADASLDASPSDLCHLGLNSIAQEVRPFPVSRKLLRPLSTRGQPLEMPLAISEPGLSSL